MSCPAPGLDDGAVELRVAATDTLADAALAAACRRLLTPEERARELRYRFEADRRAFLLARTLLRTSLSRHADVAPADWRFEFNAQGKPAIAPAHGAPAARLAFNLSHTRGVVVLALAARRALGVDVEPHDRTVELAVAERFFAPRETAALRRLPAAAQPARFIELWTLKESYVKACGLGLSMPLADFAFDLEAPGRIGLAFEPGVDDEPARWHFEQFRSPAGDCIALCVERGGRAPVLRLLRSEPLGGEQPLALVPLRRSAVGARPDA